LNMLLFALLALFVCTQKTVFSVPLAQNCSYESPTSGKYYDLIPLQGMEIVAHWVTVWKYEIEICASTYQCGRQIDSGFCQTSQIDPTHEWSVGKFSGFGVVEGTPPTPTVIILNYTGGEPVNGLDRAGTVEVTCDETATTPTNIQANNPPDPVSYKVTFNSKEACAKVKPVNKLL